jgi:hypothetical protein
MNTAVVAPANFTRKTVDLPAKFRREGRFALIPLYHLLRLSDLAREGIARSGSYRFADHIYRDEASGVGWFGRWLDRRLLNLAASRAMRGRYLRAREEMHRACRCHFESEKDAPFRILTVPCGIPRDVRDFAEQLKAKQPELQRLIEYNGMDLDPAVCAAAESFLAGSALHLPRVLQGNALDPKSYTGQRYHFISSTGLGEFLGDDDLATLYSNVFETLTPGGVFFTSATAFEGASDALLRSFELHSHYRTRFDLKRLLGGQPWSRVEFERHESGLQTFVRAIR